MIGIISSLTDEVKGLVELMDNTESTKKAGLEFVKGTIFDKDIVVLECGIGKVNAAVGTQILIDLYSPDVVINTGIAGSLAKDLTVGDIVISSDCVEHDLNRTALDEPKGLIKFPDEERIDIPADEDTVNRLAECCKGLGSHVRVGRIASGDMFVTYVRQRENISFEFNALCCEMEGGAVGHTCYMNKVPFAILRSISDDMKFYRTENYEEFKQLAADRAIKALKKFIQSD